MGRYLPNNLDMARRRPGTLLPLEVGLLEAAVELQRAGQGDCYGYALAKALAGDSGDRRLVAHGTLYKALGRLTSAGLLDSLWEDPAVAEQEGRPRRRLYRVTGAGAEALAGAHAADSAAGRRGTPWPGTAPA
jgi:PadR family transcriptional regulator, regulatory protein PadR